MTLSPKRLTDALKGFLEEDLATGDLSTSALPPQLVHGDFVVKHAGVIVGQCLPDAVYQLLGPKCHYTPTVPDGTLVPQGTVIGQASGPVADLLAGERTILNLMQRMSGIATATHLAVTTLNDPSIGILDTRKTAPGLRLFDKYAVQCGGGINHRMGLYDAVMLKDNHWHLITDFPATVRRLRQLCGPTKTIEVEVATRDQLQAAIASQVDMIMIDNQTPATARAWRKIIPTSIKVEVSGGITPTKLPAYAGSGIDFISLGYLTNSVQALDIAFNLTD
ncbi:carboxylating nicotinate-nucleotide diphosphorylase [Levilactobacillus suantsaii]|uniref:nicotinate-nucleotide diphosphorylase (carboxylating) n=1 Tax=Levilactobacillus suantsaii TaxID=2292255 RepID=A0A4Q0VIF6_9LACO|nr:carboxylating nicotinate-nucleotide diphosphorylase [Levilactobacillus suantsaii]QMU08480.1 carboxylating nicotinate-nucleotide diphosphorylase [Levilactobacillus suantsaii]RXI76450.1 carboxylating nicotinate-nucleotide diphosphorylase [Levilactobacillus suantsaii]